MPAPTTTYSDENVGAGDFTVQRTAMMTGPDRWAVVRFGGHGSRVLYTLPTRSAAVRAARSEWKAATR